MPSSIRLMQFNEASRGVCREGKVDETCAQFGLRGGVYKLEQMCLTVHVWFVINFTIFSAFRRIFCALGASKMCLWPRTPPREFTALS